MKSKLLALCLVHSNLLNKYYPLLIHQSMGVHLSPRDDSSFQSLSDYKDTNGSRDSLPTSILSLNCELLSSLNIFIF